MGELLEQIRQESERKGPRSLGLRYPSTAEIRDRAYQRYLSRGADHGGDIGDWLAATADVLCEVNRGKVRPPKQPKRPLPRQSVRVPAGTALEILNELRTPPPAAAERVTEPRPRSRRRA